MRLERDRPFMSGNAAFSFYIRALIPAISPASIFAALTPVGQLVRFCLLGEAQVGQPVRDVRALPCCLFNLIEGRSALTKIGSMIITYPLVEHSVSNKTEGLAAVTLRYSSHYVQHARRRRCEPRFPGFRCARFAKSFLPCVPLVRLWCGQAFRPGVSSWMCTARMWLSSHSAHRAPVGEL